MTPVDDLRQVGGNRVAPKPEFAVAPHVLWAAANDGYLLPNRDEESGDWHHSCVMCGQSVAVMSTVMGQYRYTEEQLTGLTVAHLIQRHGWTRETTGE
jgi:hypothetical protein